MAYQDQFYTLGTVSVINGSPSVTGTGTGWETALIEGGVFYASGAAYPILSVESETALTLAIPYIGPTAADIVYAIDRQRSAAVRNVAMNDRLAQIIREITIGNIEQLNGLDLQSSQLLQTDENGVLQLFSLVAGKLLYTDADAKLTLSDIKSAALALLNLSGTAAADRLPYLTGENGAGLTVLTALARSVIASSTGAAMFAAMGATQSLGGNLSSGYQKLPSGLIIQWGSAVVTTGGEVAIVNYPITYPFTAFITVVCNGDTNSAPSTVFGVHNNTATTHFVLRTAGLSGTVRANWLSVGR